MADRVAAVVQDEDAPVIESVYTMTVKHKTTDAPTDMFSQRAELLKGVDGLGTNFKKNTTRKINKFYQSRDGEVQSKQIHEKEFLTGYDTFEVVEPDYNQEYLAKLYELSAPHYAAVNAKVANIVGLGYRFVENNKSKRNFERFAEDKKKTKAIRVKLEQHRDELTESLESMNAEDTFTEILVKVWRDYEVTGNGYIEIGRKRDGSIGYIGHIPAQTMRIRRSRDGFVQLSGFKAQFFANYGAGVNPKTGAPQPVSNPLGGGTPNEVIHLKKYSPTSGYYGVPDIIAAKQAVAGDEFAARFNLDYFEHKAVPRYAIIVKGATLGSQALQSLTAFFETGLKGTNHRSVIVPVPQSDKDNPVDIKFEKIEAGTQDSSFNTYKKSNRADILMAHRVPITKISVADGASLAVARDADKTFKEQVCAPEQRILEKKLNRVIAEMSDALVIALNEMTLTDENTQSQIDERRRKTGVETANEQRLRRGQPAIEGGDELFDMNGKSKQGVAEQAGTVNRERDAQRSANATDSAGEARNPKGEGRTTP